jgi:hypothetical protein
MPQAETVDIPKRLPLVISPENRGESTSFDSRLVNCYTEKTKAGDYHIFPRYGLAQDSQPSGGSAAGRGVFNWLGNIYSIFADKLYKNGVAVSGTVDTTNGVYRFSQSKGATPKLQLGNGVKGYNYDDAGGLVVIIDPDFPASFVKGWAYLDGTTYIMVPAAFIQGSDINDPTSWSALNSILAQIEPDNGVALDKQLVYVIALKQWSTEVFYDAGNSTGSPLGTVQGAKINWGCASSDSVQDVNNTLCWLTRSEEAGRQVVAMENLKAKVVSIPPIERLLQNADLSTVFSWQIKVDGHRFYVLTVKNANLTLAYDLTQDMWSQWTDVNGNYIPIVSSTYNSAGKTIVQHESNGRLYLADSTYATDAGDTITVDIYTPNFDGGVRRRKNMTVLEVISDQKVGSELLIRVNDHDFDPKMWSNFRKVDLSQRRPFLTDCGTFVRRVHHLRHQKPVRMPRLQAIEMQIDLGTL